LGAAPPVLLRRLSALFCCRIGSAGSCPCPCPCPCPCCPGPCPGRPIEARCRLRGAAGRAVPANGEGTGALAPCPATDNPNAPIVSRRIAAIARRSHAHASRTPDTHVSGLRRRRSHLPALLAERRAERPESRLRATEAYSRRGRRRRVLPAAPAPAPAPGSPPSPAAAPSTPPSTEAGPPALVHIGVGAEGGGLAAEGRHAPLGGGAPLSEGVVGGPGEERRGGREGCDEARSSACRPNVQDSGHDEPA
jgi:hypothetical protein